ncbi:MAG TPA: hypothetical protein VGL93_17530 [Streptosporangiaceae bacterium]|jgi:hypothetical protein
MHLWMGIFSLIGFVIVGCAVWLFSTMSAQRNREANLPREPAVPGEVTYTPTKLGTWAVTVVQANGRTRQVYALDEDEAHRKGEQLAEQARADT